MKNSLIEIVNKILGKFNIRITRKSNIFNMSFLLSRLAIRNPDIKTVIDIGASDGRWSFECMEYLPNVSYLAIEALEERIPALEITKKKLPNFDYDICVAGEEDGESVTFNVSSDLDGSTVNGQHSGTQRICSERTIDSLVNEKKLVGPYFLKFDTHGFELPILSGCENVLKNTVAILMEVYNYNITKNSLLFFQMCQHLEKLGFRPADVANPLLRKYDNTFWQIDILFLRIDSKAFDYPNYE